MLKISKTTNGDYHKPASSPDTDFKNYTSVSSLPRPYSGSSITQGVLLDNCTFLTVVPNIITK